MISQGPESDEAGWRIRGRRGVESRVKASAIGEREESKVMEFMRVPRTAVQLVAELQVVSDSMVTVAFGGFSVSVVVVVFLLLLVVGVVKKGVSFPYYLR